MENRHLIAKQVFELRVGFNQAQVPQLQESFSQHYWQSVVPAFEQLFDRLVSADELVRVDRLELDVGRWSTEDIISGRFVESLMLHLETVITDALRGTGSAVDALPMRIGQFDLWLYFLEHGYLPSAASQPDSAVEWQQAVLGCLSAGDTARNALRHLLLRRASVLERLIYQHDAAFLQQLLEHFDGHKSADWSRRVDEVVATVIRALTVPSDQLYSNQATPAELETIANALFDWLSGLLAVSVDRHFATTLKYRIMAHLNREASSPTALAQGLLRADAWRAVLKDLVAAENVDHLAQQATKTLHESPLLQQLTQPSAPTSVSSNRALKRSIELAVWRVLCDQVVIKGGDHTTATLLARVIRSDALLPWQGQLIRALDSETGGSESSSVWGSMVRAIKALPASIPVSRPEKVLASKLDNEIAPLFPEANTTQSLRGTQESDVFYVQAVGVILLHPFLPRLFEKLQLCESGAFIDETRQQRAVCLIHHLATGELNTPEYKLVLPKFLCGVPFNAPLDHFIEISRAEQDECKHLMTAAIEHWGALGQSSPDWLREMFFQRDGKLEKRETGWQLRVERKAQDLLLDRLPHGWGLGMVKLPWMDELLRIDW